MIPRVFKITNGSLRLITSDIAYFATVKYVILKFSKKYDGSKIKTDKIRIKYNGCSDHIGFI